MSNIPHHLKYTEQHEWVSLEGDIATVGITDFAQGALGDLVFVEMPAIGREVKAGESFVVVESVKAASEVYAPLSGQVIEINAALAATPELINSAPYTEGWICKIKAGDTGELDALLDAGRYQSLAA